MFSMMLKYDPIFIQWIIYVFYYYNVLMFKIYELDLETLFNNLLIFKMNNDTSQNQV